MLLSYLGKKVTKEADLDANAAGGRASKLSERLIIAVCLPPASIHILIRCGHCTNAAMKRKRPYSRACENYIPAPPDEDRFVRKEYLSKKLLDRVLQMELLPEITDAASNIR